MNVVSRVSPFDEPRSLSLSLREAAWRRSSASADYGQI